MTSSVAVPEPGPLSIGTDGSMQGRTADVRGYWVHRSVNVGDDPFVTLFCYAADAGQNYGLIADAGGMAQLVVADGNGGWTTRPNPDHIGYRMEAY